MTITDKLSNEPVYVFEKLASEYSEKDATAMEIVSFIYKNPKVNEIEKARKLKGTEFYDKYKRFKSQSVRWAFYDPLRTKGNDLGNDNEMMNPTGFIYMDIDAKDIDGIISITDTFSTSAVLQSLFNLPYVLSVWRSFGGEGLGVLCSADGYNHNNFAEYYHDISAHIFQNTGLICDAACAEASRLNVISSDTNIMLKEGDLRPYFLRKYKSVYSDPQNNVFKKFNNDPESDQIVEQELTKNGWKQTKNEHWCRPGKAHGVSAIFNKKGRYEGKIRVFTDSADIAPKMYDKAELVKELAFGGDSKKFTKWLYTRYPPTGQSAPMPVPTTSPNLPVTSRNGIPANDEPDEIDKIIESLEIQGKVEIVDMVKDFGCFSVFPPALGSALETYALRSGLKREFIMHASLFAISTLTQGKVILHVNENGHKEAPTFWGMTIGRPGEGKTPPHQVLLSPILNKIQEKLNLNYEDELARYETFQELPSKQKKEIENEFPGEGQKRMKPPTHKQIIVTDGTMEGLIQSLRDNTSTAYYIDEIEALFSSMNSYRGGAGSDVQVFLKLFGRSTIQKKLATGYLYAKNPFVPITGTGTPKRIFKLLRRHHAENGMYERFTYWMTPTQKPEEIKAREHKSRLEFHENQPSAEMALAQWNNFIHKAFDFFHLRSADSPIELRYETEAIPELEQWEIYFNEQEAEHLRNGNETRASLIGKVRIYFHRLPILFWVARKVGSNPSSEVDFRDFENPRIGLDDIHSAMNIIRYLMSTWEYVHDELFNVSDPNTLDTSALSDYRKQLAFRLHDKNKGVSARKITEAINRLTPGKSIVNSTVSRWLKERNK